MDDRGLVSRLVAEHALARSVGYAPEPRKPVMADRQDMVSRTVVDRGDRAEATIGCTRMLERYLRYDPAVGQGQEPRDRSTWRLPRGLAVALPKYAGDEVLPVAR